MRVIVYGAGGVGGTIGGFLHHHGHDVVLVARGAHLDALVAGGLELRSPTGTHRLAVPAVGHPRELRFDAGDVVVLTMKGQDTAAALDDLVRSGYRGPVVCAQNGVANERMALRRFEAVLRAVRAAPGHVPRAGRRPLPLRRPGRPARRGSLPQRQRRHGGGAGRPPLEASGFLSEADPAVMGKKYAKLLMNLGNSLDAACGRAGWRSELGPRARAEGRAVLAAAGIEVVDQDPERMRRVTIRPVGEEGHKGSSSWQSLARGTGSIEADWLNGEITLLGRLHGVPTPVNALLQEVANELARERRPPGSYTVEQLLARLG